MDSTYSKAFDHLSVDQIHVTKGAFSEPKASKRPEPVRRSVGRSAVRKHSQDVSITVVNTTPDNDNMGQGQTTPEYIDIFDSEPRRISQKHKEEWERANSVESESITLRRDEFLHRGHTNEDATDYCYAYSGSVSRDSVDDVDGLVPMQFHRSVSLKDDYSQPPDRLSVSAQECHTDYTEPYRTNMNRNDPRRQVQSSVVPDPKGIYEFAKDINAVPRPNLGARSQSSAAGDPSQRQDSYSHLNSAINKLQQTKLSDTNAGDGGTACYDHLWNSSIDNPVSPAGSSKTDRVTSPKTSTSSADEVFTSASRKPLAPNYEEPWDSQEGQDRFTKLLSKAEKTDARRQSVDKQSSVNQPSPAQRTVKLSVDNSVDKNKSDKNVPVKATSPKIIKEIPPSYEDAWDLPEKQREFEEKLAKARKASQGQLALDEAVEKKTPSVSPVNRRSWQEVERRLHDTPRADSCRSLGALAEKVDTSIPLEDQNFYHGTIKRSDAERMLCVFRDGSYLVRRSETSKNDYSLTMKGLNGLPMHMKIARTPEGKFVLGENSPPFTTIPDMIYYYTSHKLPIQNADKICLLYPIPC